MNDTERLYVQAKRAVRKVLSEYEQDWDIVDDLLHEVFTQALGSEHSGGSTYLTWVCGIAKNVGRQHVRAVSRDKRQFEVLESGLPGLRDEDGALVDYYDRVDISTYAAETTANLDPLALVEASSTVEDAVSHMPVQMGRCVLLRERGYSNSDIAAALGTSLSSVEVQMSRARNYFKNLVKYSEFTATNRAYERAMERSEYSSMMDWANEATPLRKRASMRDVIRQHRDRFWKAFIAILMRHKRRYGECA